MKYLFGFATLFLSICGKAQTTADAVLQKMHATISGHKSMSYDLHFKFKFFDNDDTLIFSTKVALKRDKKDTLFNGAFRFTLMDTSEKVYDLKNIYHIEPAKKLITRYSPHKNERELSIINGNIQSRVISRTFLQPENIKDIIKDAESRILLNDTVIRGSKCYSIRIKYPDEDGFTDKYNHMYVNKSTMEPVLQCNSVKFQGQVQYVEFNYSNCVYDKVSQDKFSPKYFPKYEIKDNVIKTKPFEPKKLEGGAPLLKGDIYGRKEKGKEVDFKGKVTILDFWYMACYPCVKAIPHVNRLYNEYKDKGLQVFGVNSYDNKSAHLAKMPGFLEHNKIDYPILMVNDSLPKTYNVEVWPTLYIVDKEGKVAFSSYGYSDSTYYELKQEIDKYIK